MSYFVIHRCSLIYAAVLRSTNARLVNVCERCEQERARTYANIYAASSFNRSCKQFLRTTQLNIVDWKFAERRSLWHLTMFLYIIIICIALLFLLYRKVTSKVGKWEKKGVFCLKNYPLIGSFPEHLFKVKIVQCHKPNYQHYFISENAHLWGSASHL